MILSQVLTLESPLNRCYQQSIGTIPFWSCYSYRGELTNPLQSLCSAEEGQTLSQALP